MFHLELESMMNSKTLTMAFGTRSTKHYNVINIDQEESSQPVLKTRLVKFSFQF